MIITASLAALALLAADPPTAASATTSAAAHPVAPVEPKPAETDKVVCENQMTTGTRFTTKICHTRAEWDAIHYASRDNARHMTQGAFTGQPQD